MLLTLLAAGAYKTQRVWGMVRDLQAHLDTLQAATQDNTETELSDLEEILRATHADLQALRGELGLLMPLASHLGWVPGLGGDLQAAPALFDAAQAITEAGMVTLEGLEPLLALAEGHPIEGEPLAVVLETLSQASPNFETAQDGLAQATLRRREIDEEALSPRVADLVAQLDRYLPLMQTGLDVGRLLPDLLGASDRRTYLILAQNNDELRATGGLISAVGTLVLDEGEIVELSFEDSYAIDDFGNPYPDPPAPYRRYMGVDLWVFRDANWWPDFATSAQKAVELYQISRDLEPDGVLAVDQHALHMIVEALAPLEVEGWPEAVHADNVISLIRMAWSPNEVENWQGWDAEWWRQRKGFVSDLVSAMRAKVEEAPAQVDWLTLARALLRTLEQRHLQIWLADSSSPAAKLLAEQGWDGTIRSASNDYLMVVDTNLGFNKVNAAIQESIDYRVLVSADGTAQATLIVRHVNPGATSSTGVANCDHRPRYGDDYADMIARCYWDYMRVYAAEGSQLYAATAHPIAPKLLITGQRQDGAVKLLPKEHGKTVFASFFVLPHNQEIETRFVYQLPSKVIESSAPSAQDESWQYKLLVQKQAGTGSVPLHVTLDLPPGAWVQAVEVLEDSHSSVQVQRPESNTVTFETNLERDRVFQVSFQMGKTEQKEGK